ncbi:MAG: SsrA-binding protein SmpB [Polyangiaceae bacterium]|nr:SsrA-binding protein SmpB [Polyangiaceae bacterium]
MAPRKKKETNKSDTKPIATNRKASFDYELGDRFEAGLVLVGSEVKSLRSRTAGITEAWACVRSGEAFLEGMRISILDHAAYGHTSERRARKLLLHRKEIRTIQSAIDRDGMTVVATKVYFRNGKAKVQLALASGKRKADKRETIKQRDAERDERVSLRERNR